MAKIKYDVSDVEPGIDFDTPIPIGIYKCKISEAKEDTSKSSGNEMIALTIQVLSDEKGNKEYKGRNIWDYIVLNDASEWKVRQLTDALGLPTKGSFDPRELVGEQLRVRVKHEPSDEFGTRAKVGSLLALKGKPEETDDDGDTDADDTAGDEWTLEDLEAMDREELEEVIDDEDLDIDPGDDAVEDDDDLLAAIAEELGIESDDDEGKDDEPELSYEDVMKLRMTQLKKLNKDEGLKVRISAKSKLETIREKVADALGLEPEEEEEEEEPEEIDIDELESSDFEDMDIEVMKQIIDQEELGIRITKRSKPESIAAKIMEELDIEEDDGEEDYDDMDPADLKATCKERGLSAAGTKASLIKRLRKDDEEDGDPF